MKLLFIALVRYHLEYADPMIYTIEAAYSERIPSKIRMITIK